MKIFKSTIIGAIAQEKLKLSLCHGLKRITAVVLAVCLSMGGTAVFAAEATTTQAPQSKVNGLMVRTLSNLDFPSKPNLSAKQMRDELDVITKYAKENGFNAIFFEARPKGDSLYSSKNFPVSDVMVKQQGDFTFFDPLKELISSAKDQDLAVYAVVNPYLLGDSNAVLSTKNIAAKTPSLSVNLGDKLYLDPSSTEVISQNSDDIVHMADKYKLSGIILQGMDDEGLLTRSTAYQDTFKLLESVKAALNGKTDLGIIIRDGAFTDENTEKLLSFTDMVLPVVNAPVGFQGAGFLQRLRTYAKGNNIVMPYLDAASATDISADLTVRLFTAQQSGYASTVINGYGALRFGKLQQGNLVNSMRNPSTLGFPKLPVYNPAQKLSITRPTQMITTTYATYFVTGTSNPATPVTIDGKEIDRKTNDGLFGVLVTLEMGNNAFNIQQGDKSIVVTIRRTDGKMTAQPTDKVTSSYPVSSAIMKNNETLTISCVAPAGAAVSATIGGVTIAMTQKAQASPSIPAVFTGELTLTGANAGAVTNIGKITYTLLHNGNTTSYKSSGDVFLCGEGARPRVRVSEEVASVFYDEKVQEGNYKSVYKRGTTEEIVSQMGEYYKLYSDGYIKKATVDVIEATASAATSIKQITASHNDRAERFILEGAKGLPYTFVDKEDGSVELTLHGDLALPQVLDTQSELFSSMAWANSAKGITCTIIPVDSKKVWGVDIIIEGENTVLYAKKAPKLSAIPGKPLSNLKVVLDPGHGGVDSGALGVLGMDGPFEKHVNLANAQMLKMRLEQLGAEVTLTRVSDEDTKSLYERMEITQSILPDAFIAMHHNSIAESSDGYKSDGIEAYYYEKFGKSLGDIIAKTVSETNAQRRFRQVDWGYYTVTRMRYTPSILAELAFMSNPLEYRRACDAIEIYKTADAMSVALLKLVTAAQ